LSVGDVVQAAIDAGLRVEGIPVSKSPYLDIGTAEGLAHAIQNVSAY
jgi:glucose-1-phosphate thymidylyltransferase